MICFIDYRILIDKLIWAWASVVALLAFKYLLIKMNI